MPQLMSKRRELNALATSPNTDERRIQALVDEIAYLDKLVLQAEINSRSDAHPTGGA